MLFFFFFLFLFLMAKKLRSVAYLLVRKLKCLITKAALRLVLTSHTPPPPNDDVAKLRVRGVHSLLSIYLQTLHYPPR